MVKYWFLSSPRPGPAGCSHLLGGIMPDTRFCWPPSVILTRGKMREEGRKGKKRERGREINQRFSPLTSLNSGGISDMWNASHGQKSAWCFLFARITPTPTKLSLLPYIWSKRLDCEEVGGNGLTKRRADREKVIIALNCCPQRQQQCRQVALIYIKGHRRQLLCWFTLI